LDRIETENDRLKAIVKDSGSGIEPSFLPQLFDPFTQAHSRGSQRGTGLGLSIVKQLLHKMDGSIEVESTHSATEDVELGQAGSTFTISIPMQLSGTAPSVPRTTTSSVAIFHNGNERYMEGLEVAWQKFGFEVTIVDDLTHFPDLDFTYIWADWNFLNSHSDCLEALLEKLDSLVLIPYDTPETLSQIELHSAPQFIPLQKPLLWHSFAERIAAAKRNLSKPGTGGTGRTVRFATEVDILNGRGKSKKQEATENNLTILLVEDNPVYSTSRSWLYHANKTS
jgi:hypothetical protein